MRLLVTGSRAWTDEDEIRTRLEEFDVFAEVTLVVGDCSTGADEIAYRVATDLGWSIEVHWADWDEYGRAAGPRRNREMVDSGADWCFAFFKTGAGNKGTQGCVNMAVAAGIAVTEFWD